MPIKKKKSSKKTKNIIEPIVTIKPNRPFIKPTDPSWNPMEERIPQLGWCTF